MFKFWYWSIQSSRFCLLRFLLAIFLSTSDNFTVLSLLLQHMSFIIRNTELIGSVLVSNDILFEAAKSSLIMLLENSESLIASSISISSTSSLNLSLANPWANLITPRRVLGVTYWYPSLCNSDSSFLFSTYFWIKKLWRSL